MIKIINESDNEFNIENMVFEINLWLPIFYSNTNDSKEPYFAEDWKIDNLIIPDNVQRKDAETVLRSIDKFVVENVVPTIQTVASEYDWIMNIKTKTPSKSNTVRNPQSLAYYTEIYCDVSNINCSDIVKNKLNSFIVRVANHISPKERETIRNYGNVKLYSNQIVELEEEQFIEYLHNIFSAYEIFIGSLSLYPRYIENFSDISYGDIALLKQVAVQGRFDGYEK